MMALNWLMILIVFLLLPKQLHSQTDTTHFDFNIFDGKETNLIYQGDAHIPVGQSLIRLTRTAPPNRTHPQPTPLQNSVGRVLYSPPIRLWDGAARRQANFQTVIRGFIGNPWSGFIGDGIAFFIAPLGTTIPTGSTGGNMGLYDSTGTSPTPLFAVELDVFMNTWDPNYRHVGININSRNSVAVDRWDSGGFERFVEARITYDARARLISVVANATHTHSAIQPIIGRVQHAIDMKTLLPEWVQIGISASTGPGPAALQDIRRWSFTSFMISDHNDDNHIRQYV